MLKRHEDALMQRFDAVANRGFAYVEWWEVYLWYGMERLSKTVWRDLQDRFEETAGKNGKGELWVHENQTGMMLVNSGSLKNISDKLG